MADKVVNLQPLEIENAPKESAELLKKAKEQLGFIPNMYKYFANNPALFIAYTSGYEAFRAHSGFTPQEQEVVFLTVSYENECDYCMAAHSFVGDKMTNVPTEVTDAIRDGKTVPDAKLEALRSFTKTVYDKRGWVDQADVDAFRKAGYTDEHVFGVIAGVGVKTFSNYMNHMARTPVDEAFASRKWSK